MPNKKVLIIDDDPTVIKLNTSLLTSNDYDVITATDGAEGLKMAQEQKPDAILLDLILPGMHGFEVCKELKKSEDTKLIPVVIVTGSGLEEIAESEPEVQADAYLAKPYNLEKMEEAMIQAAANCSKGRQK